MSLISSRVWERSPSCESTELRWFASLRIATLQMADFDLATSIMSKSKKEGRPKLIDIGGVWLSLRQVHARWSLPAQYFCPDVREHSMKRRELRFRDCRDCRVELFSFSPIPVIRLSRLTHKRLSPSVLTHSKTKVLQQQ